MKHIIENELQTPIDCDRNCVSHTEKPDTGENPCFKSEEQLFNDYNKAYEAQDRESAIKILKTIIERFPKNESALLTYIDNFTGVVMLDSSGLHKLRSLLAEGLAKFPESREMQKRVNTVSMMAFESVGCDKLAPYKDKHKDERCVIIGNGPSLNKMDMSFLKDEICFGFNRIFLGFEKWNFTPTYYVSVNKLVIEQSTEDILNIPCPKFINSECYQQIPLRDDVIHIMSRISYDSDFSRDPRKGLFLGSTVTYVALQIAYFMGFQEIILIGVDHKFNASGTPHQTVISNGDDSDHFDSGYFGKGFKWQLPDLDHSAKMYSKADEIYKADGRKIIDATLNGHCPVFNKMDYKNIFYNKKSTENAPKQIDHSGSDIESFKNKYQGHRAFILGNGPSLVETPLNLLKNEFTFAMNRISLIYEKVEWRPSFFSCTTTNVENPDWRRDVEKTLSLGIPSFIWDKLKQHVSSTPNIHYINCTHGSEIASKALEDWWSYDVAESVCKFGSSILVALQIAVYMGFGPIYLIGCDLGFRDEKDENGRVIPNASGGNDPNHFDPGYGTPGISYSKAFDVNKLNTNMLAAHTLALNAARKAGVQIYNATLGGELEIYPRVNLFDILENSTDKLVTPCTTENLALSLNEDKINFIDVGSAGDLPFPWDKNRDKIQHILKFEPRDNAEEKPNVITIDTALWGTSGERNFYIYKGLKGTGSSLFHQNYEWVDQNFDKIKNQGNMWLAETWHDRSQLVRTETVFCNTLDNILDKQTFPYHFLKIDAQGAEYHILKGAEKFLSTSCIGLYLELFTMPLYKNIKLLPEVEEYLKEFGFELVKKFPPHGSFNSQHDCLFLKNGVDNSRRWLIEEIYSMKNNQTNSKPRIYPIPTFNQKPLPATENIKDKIEKSSFKTDVKNEYNKTIVDCDSSGYGIIELLDPLDIDPIAYGSGLLEKIRQFSLLPNKRMGWNYCLDYTWIAMRCKELIKPGLRILDIGCGPGAIHGYLENEHNVDIIGIDLHRWGDDYVDIVGDFTDENLRKKHGLNANTLDLIISSSAFEHNTPDAHKHLVDVCLKSLKPGGHLITTFAVAEVRGYEKTAEQWNLAQGELEAIYGLKFNSFNYNEVWNRWRCHREIPNNYQTRYGKWSSDDPLFIAAGADIIKN